MGDQQKNILEQMKFWQMDLSSDRSVFMHHFWYVAKSIMREQKQKITLSTEHFVKMLTECEMKEDTYA